MKDLNEVYRKSGLGKWFHDESAGGKPGWDRYNSKGQRVGECGDAKKGEPYAACLSKQKAAKLGKKKIGSFVERKRAAQSAAGRGKKGSGKKGKKPINVDTGIREEYDVDKKGPSMTPGQNMDIDKRNKRFKTPPCAIDNKEVKMPEYEDYIIGEEKTPRLNKPMKGDVKKFKVYVKNEKGNIVKVNFGDKNMSIKRDNPARRKNFRARHSCDDNPGPKTKARYWSCQMWRADKSVGDMLREAAETQEIIDLIEKNVPKKPKKWSACKAQAKKKFDVYPSAYANAWAAKCYKKKGGKWKSVSEQFAPYIDSMQIDSTPEETDELNNKAFKPEKIENDLPPIQRNKSGKKFNSKSLRLENFRNILKKKLNESANNVPLSLYRQEFPNWNITSPPPGVGVFDTPNYYLPTPGMRPTPYDIPTGFPMEEPNSWLDDNGKPLYYDNKGNPIVPPVYPGDNATEQEMEKYYKDYLKFFDKLVKHWQNWANNNGFSALYKPQWIQDAYRQSKIYFNLLNNLNLDLNVNDPLNLVDSGYSFPNSLYDLNP
jgi:hypothetical protein